VGHTADMSAALQVARWEAILATAFDAIISIGEDGTIRLFNRAAEAIFGYEASEVLGRPVEMLMPSPYREEHRDYMRRYEETGIPRAIGRIRKVEARRKSGELFPIELSVSRAQVGDDILYSAIIRDVSVQTRLEAELRAYGRREAALARLGLAALDENLPRLCQEASTLVAEVLGIEVALVLLAMDGRLVVHGSTGSLHRVGTRLPLPVVPTETQLVVPEALADDRIVSGLTVPIGVARHPLGLVVAGARRPLAFSAEVVNFVQSTSNVLAEAIGRQRAEEERERLLRRARRRERLADIGTLTAKVLHDLGNPLAGLSMTAQSILRRIERAPGDELATIRASVERLVLTMRRLDTLLSEFKSFSREHHLDLRELRLQPFLGSVIGLWEAEAAQRDVTLALGTCGEKFTVRADPDQLHRVLDNVLKNALEAIEHGPGRVEVSVEARLPDRVAILVTDSGPGLPPALDVFALFVTTKSEGTGLGLPTCRQIVEAHGGQITAESRSPRGAVITIELPRSPRV
jgi:two-component system sensor kinase FixL